MTMMGPAGDAGPGAGGSEARIVVGVDGSDNATRALEWAAAQAARTGATLVIHTAYLPGYVFLTDADVEQALRMTLDESIAHVKEREPGVHVEGIGHKAPPAAALISASEGADLLVVGSRGLGGFRGLLLGSVSQQCSLHAQCPVVIVR